MCSLFEDLKHIGVIYMSYGCILNGRRPLVVCSETELNGETSASEDAGLQGSLSQMLELEPDCVICSYTRINME